MNIAVDEALLILKVGFIVLLYLFIWRIVRSASRDFRTGPVGRERDPGADRRGGARARTRRSARSWSS